MTPLQRSKRGPSRTRQLPVSWHAAQYNFRRYSLLPSSDRNIKAIVMRHSIVLGVTAIVIQGQQNNEKECVLLPFKTVLLDVQQYTNRVTRLIIIHRYFYAFNAAKRNIRLTHCETAPTIQAQKSKHRIQFRHPRSQSTVRLSATRWRLDDRRRGTPQRLYYPPLHVVTTGRHGSTYRDNAMARRHGSSNKTSRPRPLQTPNGVLLFGRLTPHGIAKTRLGAACRINEMARRYTPQRGTAMAIHILEM